MKSSTLIYQISTVLFSRVLVKLIGIITISILILVLTPEEMGIYGLFISSLFLSATLGNLGVKHSVIRALSRDYSALLKPCIKGIRKHIVTLAILTMLLMFSMMFSTISEQEFSLQIIIPMLLASVFFLVVNLQQGIYLGKGDVKSFNLLEVSPRLLFLVMVFLTVYALNMNISEHVISLYCVALFCSLLFIIKYNRIESFKFKIFFDSNESSENLELVKKGLPYCIALFVILVNSRVPLYLGDVYFSKDVVGKFFAASRLNDMVLEAATAASLIFFSASAKNISFKEMLKSFVVVIVLMVIAAVTISVLLRLEFLVNFIPDYIDSIEYLKILLIGVPFVALNKMLYGFISGQGKPLVGFYIYIVAIIFQILLFNVLGESLGPAGLVYSLISSQLLVAFLLSIYTYCYFRKGIQNVS